ncbi:MAG: transketolase [Succinivibrionaceae bacterium]|nr:transketolase [Succinivibrionaceae bacterium]
MTETNLKKLSYELRRDVVQMIINGKGGHIGGDMSVIDALVVLYFHEMGVTPATFGKPGQDHFVMSKGHSVEALYAVLAKKGFFSREKVLAEFSQFGSPFIGHPNNKLPGIEMNSGALGHGLPVAVGMAIGERMNGTKSRTYVVMGDGEQAEGSVWEGAMAAANYHLDNLCAVLDRNTLQISGDTENVMALLDINKKWESFGWHVIDVADGNDHGQLISAFGEARLVKGKPSILILHTVKGKGSKVMENKAAWHHHLPTLDEYKAIMDDLEKAEKEA